MILGSGLPAAAPFCGRTMAAAGGNLLRDAAAMRCLASTVRVIAQKVAALEHSQATQHEVLFMLDGVCVDRVTADADEARKAEEAQKAEVAHKADSRGTES